MLALIIAAPAVGADDPFGRPPRPAQPGALPALPGPPPPPRDLLPDSGVRSSLPALPPADSKPNFDKVGEFEMNQARAAYADRLLTMAQEQLQGGDGSPPFWQQGAVVLDVASRLKPNDPRYPRIQVEVRAEMRDVPGTIQALKDYAKALHAQQGLTAAERIDEGAQLRTIELYVAQMQRVDERLDYLKAVLQKEGALSPEVRSAVAVMMVPLVWERSQSQAIDLVRRAVALNPYNLKARQYEYELISSNAGPAQEATALAALLRCKPQQPEVILDLAHLLAEVGLHSESLVFFEHWASLARRSTLAPEASRLNEAVLQFLLSGRRPEAERWSSELLQADRTNVDGWLMRLAMDRGQIPLITYNQLLANAEAVFESRAAHLAKLSEHAEMGDRAPQGPVNAGAQLPQLELTAAVERLVKPTAPPVLRAEFTSAVTDLAWFHLYFNRQPMQAQRWMVALKKLLPPEEVTLQRLDGWTALLAGRDEEAWQKLEPIHTRDPLAALGVIDLLNKGEAGAAPGGPAVPPGVAPELAPGVPATAPTAPATAPAAPATAPAVPGPALAPAPAGGAFKPDPARAKKLAQTMLNGYRSGLMGMFVISHLRQMNLKPERHFAADAVSTAVLPGQILPIGWMEIVNNPSRFYLVSGRALEGPNRLGEPMFVEVTIQNRTAHPLAMGTDGVIGNDVLLDTEVNVNRPLRFDRIAYDKFGQKLVLGPSESVSRIVKLNQGELGKVLWSTPAASIAVFVTATTNPMALGEGMVPGPAGIRTQFARAVTRLGAPINTEAERDRLREALKGLPEEKLWALDVHYAFIRQAEEPGAAEDVTRRAGEFRARIVAAQQDLVPHVAAWASYRLAQLTPPAERFAVLAPLAQSPHSEIRVMLLTAAAVLPPADQKRLGEMLNEDTNALVRSAAAVRIQLADYAAKTAATQPATQPGVAPSTPTTPAVPVVPVVP